MCSSNPLFLPSEPPEIGNWFSSYVYESPELNTGEDFEAFGHPLERNGQKNGFEEERSKEREEKLEEKTMVRERDGFVVGGEKVVFNAIVRRKNSGGDAVQYESKVMDSSDSLSLSSEPPDIKNWFSSYVYESPSLEPIDFPEFSEYKEGKFGTEGYNAEKEGQEKEENLRESTCTRNRNAFSAGQKLALSVVATSNSTAKDNKYELQNVSQNKHEVDGKRSSTMLNGLPVETISDQILEGKEAIDYDASIKDVEKTRLNGTDFAANLNFNRRFGNNSVISPRKLSQRRDSTEENSGFEAQTRVLSETNLDLAPTNEDRKRSLRINGKENDGSGFGESGFISTKTKSRKDKNLMRRPVGAQSETLRNEVTVSSAGNKDATISRRVLSETTNFQHSNEFDTTGKWQCPQKSKPKLGPPLKQLRLEQWVHKI